MITLKKEDGAADLNGITKLTVGVSWDPSGAPAAARSDYCAASAVWTWI